MYVRLAFAVAAYLESEILIVDEVLAVGDAEFQKKCLGKMNEVSKAEGRTILFVSHNMEAIAKLTKSCVVLNNGSNIFTGPTPNAINEYFSLNKHARLKYENFQEKEIPFVKKVELITSLPNNVQLCGDKMEIIIDLQTRTNIKNACFSFQITDYKDRNFCHLWIFDADMPYCRTPGLHRLKCIIPSLKLYMGTYYIKCHFTGPPTSGEYYEILENICPFEVVMHEKERSNFAWQPDTCAYIEESSWKVEKII